MLSSGQVVRLSRTYGLLAAPQWLATVSSAPQWAQALLPMTLAQSPYNPTRLFNLQPGDELGYLTQPFTISPFPAPESKTLLRITTRQQTADSLLITFQEQTRTEPKRLAPLPQRRGCRLCQRKQGDGRFLYVRVSQPNSRHCHYSRENTSGGLRAPLHRYT